MPQLFSRFPKYLFLFFFLSSAKLFGQDKFTISGYVKDKTNGETLFGANIYEEEGLRGTTSNEYGFYSLTLPAGQYKIVASYIGYTSIDTSITLSGDIRINIDLLSEAQVTEEVVVTSERKDRNVYETQMGTVELQVDKIKSIPVLLGEVDILKTIQLLPGVQASGVAHSVVLAAMS